ncbi:hypothetical protein, conserved [Eimeria praecox]|uniref:Uncharacterized protein n=1 Tax=Eimeria praecox TaxID=51316 RepID=U6GBZ2_9EIME|nr:hypothetical protein, conserved [Eimeria praecox]
MTCKLATMRASKFLRHAAAAAAAVAVLGTFQVPSDPSNRVGFCGGNFGYIWAVEAGDSNGRDSEEGPSDMGGDDRGSEGGGAAKSNAKDASVKQMNEGDGNPNEDGGNAKSQEAQSGDSKKQSNLRGSASNNKNSTLLQPANATLERIFGMFSDLGKDANHPLAEQVKEAKDFNEFIDRVFVPRLQTPPKYAGALECLNESIYRDLLSGPKKAKTSPHMLQHAYSALRRSPMVLEVPALFIELRQDTDKREWEVRRRREIHFYERKGEPIPERVQLSAEDVMALEAEEPRDREEDISEPEMASRVTLINGWMKEQFRLRLYYRQRIGLLKGDPQDLVDTFNPGPQYVSVSVEEVIGLSYNAVLDPEPEIDDSEINGPSARAAEF